VPLDTPEPLDRSGRTPAWAQIEASLRTRIESGELGAGQRLPAERDMARRLGVSRMTVRQALAALADEGLVERGVGQGTFVSGVSKVTFDLTRVEGLTAAVERQGMEAGARVLEARERPAPPAVARGLRLQPGAAVVRVRRVRTAGGRPLALEDAWLPAARVPGLLERDLRGSVTRILREDYALAMSSAIECLEPVAAGAFEARVLGVPVGSALMLVERVFSESGGRPLEYARDRHRGDRSRFLMRTARL
jgi:GntR family transcriptional regulator